MNPASDIIYIRLPHAKKVRASVTVGESIPKHTRVNGLAADGSIAGERDPGHNETKRQYRTQLRNTWFLE